MRCAPSRFAISGLIFFLAVTTGWAQDANTTASLTTDAEATAAADQRIMQSIPSNKATPPAAPTMGPNRPAGALLSTESIILATWDGGNLTNQEVSATLKMRKPRSLGNLPVESVISLPITQQREVVRDLAYEQILVGKARAEGINEKLPTIAKSLEESRASILARMYYEREVQPKLSDLSEETALEYYEQNKESLYTRPAKTLVRNVHVGIHQPHTVKEGETLKELAADITGDAAAAKDILRGESPYYNRETLPENQDDVLSSPLKAEEKLLIPLSKTGLTSRTKIAEDLRKRLIANPDVDAAVKEFADSGDFVTALPPMTLDAAGYWPSVYKAVTDAGNTSVTDVIKTPAGLEIFVIVEKNTTSTIPFDELRAELVSKAVTDEDLKKKTIEGVRKQTLDRLFDRYNVEISTETLALKAETPNGGLTTGTVVTNVAGMDYTAADLMEDLRLIGKTWNEASVAEKLDVTRSAPRVISALIVSEAKRLGLDQSARFDEELKSKATIEITNEYLKREGQRDNALVTDQVLRAYYNDNLDRYTSAAQVTIREIGKRINMTLPATKKAAAIEQAKKSLAEIRSRVTTLVEFEQAARRESESISTRSRGGLIGTVGENFRGEMFGNQLAQIKPGEITEPFMYGSEMLIVRMDDRVPPAPLPFEEARRQVARDYAREVPQKQEEEKRQQALDAAGFALKF